MKLMTDQTELELDSEENAIVPVNGICYSNKTVKVQVEFVKKFFNLSAFELDFIFFVATNIDKIDTPNKRLEFKVLEVAKALKLNSNNCYEYIDKITDKIQEKPIRVKLNEGDERRNDFEKIYWFTYIRCYKGKLTIEFSPRMLTFFQDVQNRFALIYFAELRRLKGLYAKRFYLECRAFGFQGAVQYTIEELRRKFNLEPKEYKQYSDFKRKIIKTAYDELQAKSSVYFEFEEIKERKKVVAILFKFRKKEKPKEDPNEKGEKTQTLFDVLVGYGITKNNAEKYIKALTEDVINEKIKFCLKYQQEHTVNNFGGLLNKALDGEYGSKSEFDIKQEEIAENEALEVIKRKEFLSRLENTLNEAETLYKEYAKDIFQLSIADNENLLILQNEFKQNPPNYVRGEINAEYFNTNAGNAAFRNFVVKKYAISFSNWLKQNYNAEAIEDSFPKYLKDIETGKPLESLPDKNK